ncbi:hypothetical protein NKH70_21155, partial [Mesorhizobium sp. M0991]|uniref:hypothetical protein n=1 Tax=Mesorhizobium sp. M0991 TaxID=2957043 RepID=UPI0033362CC1
QAGQKTAPDQRAIMSNYLLHRGSHPQKTLQLTALEVVVAPAAEIDFTASECPLTAANQLFATPGRSPCGNAVR